MYSGSHKRRAWIWTIIGIGSSTVFLALFVAAVPLSSNTLRHRIIEGLSWRLESDIELADLQLRVFPHLHAEGAGLVVHRRNEADRAPLISVTRFSVDAGILPLLRRHVTHVQLEGLEIDIPPKDNDDKGDPRPGDDSARHHVARDSNPSDHQPGGGVVLDTLDSSDARLVLIPRERDKNPKTWAIHQLRMRNVGIDQAMPFTATLRNAVPPGEIVTSGHFGPWQRAQPGDTPIDGAYTFNGANLAYFPGIAGTLSARGTFAGALGRLDIHGETDTPDFTIAVSGHPFPLHTKYHSIVDGTNGDTVLERIDGLFLKSTLVAKGAVLDAPVGGNGHTVTLDIDMQKARLQDIMTMAVNTTKPPMDGVLTMTTKFVLPPGENDVAQRLRLDGRFTISGARFTNYDVQGKINELSHRSRGQHDDRPTEAALSDFKGRFKLGGGMLALPDLSFKTPGTTVQLSGRYALKPETLDFRGTVLLDAKISETQTGIKRLLLKVADPLFGREGGGAAIPIKINGVRENPSFGLDVRRFFKRGDTR